MNRNPKRNPPTAEQFKINDRLFLKVNKRVPKDCSVCRKSEVHAINGRTFGFGCKAGHIVMDAPSCPDFKDSRLPSIALTQLTSDLRGGA